MNKTLKMVLAVMAATLMAAFSASGGDGSDEPGFIAPRMRTLPPPPPANIASAETFIPYPGPPAAPMARSEKKNPPNPPVMFVKIKEDSSLIKWAAVPNDLNNLMKTMKELMDVNFSCEVKGLGEVESDPDRNPILYKTGNYHFSLTDAERQKIREYLINGGTIIFNSGMGSKPFYDSAVEEMRKIFPEVPALRLSSDHPVFHSYYDLINVAYLNVPNETEPNFVGVTINCRVVALISRWGLDTGWGNINEDDRAKSYLPDSANKLGVNIMAYAVAQRAWAKQVAKQVSLVDTSDKAAGKFCLTQVIYNGEWKTRHKSLSLLLNSFNKRTDIPVKFGLKELRLTSPEIYNSPVMYMTGHEDFVLTNNERANLREYIKKGGMLIAEACCGRRGFDVAFRREIKTIMPDYVLTCLPGKENIFFMPNKLVTLGVTPALAAQLGNVAATTPKIEGIEVNGHWGVIYSPYGMCGGWEMSANPYGLNYNDSSAVALGENILMYAVTQ